MERRVELVGRLAKEGRRLASDLPTPLEATAVVVAQEDASGAVDQEEPVASGPREEADGIVINPAGYVGVEGSSIRFSADGRQMAARYIVQRSTLYVVEGLR